MSTAKTPFVCYPCHLEKPIDTKTQGDVPPCPICGKAMARKPEEARA